MDLSSKIFVTGHAGLVGSAIIRKLNASGYRNIQTATKQQLDLRNQREVDLWFSINRPEFVFIAAGKVGGILANSTYPAEFLYDNLMIASNLIESSRTHGIEKVLYLGSSCIYPKFAKQPIDETELLTGLLEQTNEPYAISKIAGIKLCDSYRRQYGCNFISAMPTNLYGPGDNFSDNSSHVIPALIKKFYDAKAKNLPYVEIWGSGTPMREFLHVDDLASACEFLMKNYNEHGHVNIGSGSEISIYELALLLQEIIYPESEIRFDSSKPDGTPRKLLNVKKINGLGWKSSTNLNEGLLETCHWYVNNADLIRQ